MTGDRGGKGDADFSENACLRDCHPLPSVTNLLTPDCDESLKSAALFDADLAFLRGVYKADRGMNENLAPGAILCAK